MPVANKTKTNIKCCSLCARKYFGSNSKCFGVPKLPICKASGCPRETKKSKAAESHRHYEYLKWKKQKDEKDALKKSKKSKKWILFG